MDRHYALKSRKLIIQWKRTQSKKINNHQTHAIIPCFSSLCVIIFYRLVSFSFVQVSTTVDYNFFEFRFSTTVPFGYQFMWTCILVFSLIPFFTFNKVIHIRYSALFILFNPFMHLAYESFSCASSGIEWMHLAEGEINYALTVWC